MVGSVRRGFSVSLCVLLMVAGLFPLLSANVYGQRRASTRPQSRQTAAPLSVYGQGYQKGYNDGFVQGQADWNRKAAFGIYESEAYQQRERLYDPRHASSEEYREGFRLGFDLGYPDGYFGRVRNASVPTNAELLYRATVLASSQRDREPALQTDQPPQRDAVPQSDPAAQRDPVPERDQTPQRDQTRPRTSAPVNVPADTEFRIQLTSPIDTKNNRAGDRFTAIVLMPGAYEGATVEGHIAKLDRSGKVTGRTELSLAFDAITLKDGRQGPFSAQLERVIESETVKEVDEEGNVRSGSRSKDSQVRGGVGATAGAIIGGIVGGVKGAIVGAVIGGAAGVGTVYIEGNKTLVLDPGTEMVIRTDRPSR